MLHQAKKAPLVISLQIYRTNLSTKAAHKMGLASKIEEQKHFSAKVSFACLSISALSAADIKNDVSFYKLKYNMANHPQTLALERAARHRPLTQRESEEETL